MSSDSKRHSSLPGLRYEGTRRYVYENGRSEDLHVLVIDHEDGPWEVVRCKTEAQARELVGLFEQLEAQGSLLAAFREEFVESFMEHLQNDRDLALECLADFEAEHVSSPATRPDADDIADALNDARFADGLHERRPAPDPASEPEAS